MELDAQHAVAQIHQAGAGIAPDDLRSLFGCPQDLKIRSGRRHAVVAKPPIRPQSLDRCRGRAERLSYADRVDDLKWTQFPPEAPLHHAIDVVNRIGNVGCDSGRIGERRLQRLAQELADLVLAAEQRPDAFPRILNRPGRLERRQPRRLTRSISQRGWVERQDFRV